MSLQTFFWDRIANNYAKQPIKDEAAYQKKLMHTQQYFSNESRVLEFGCGTGTTAVHHAPLVRHIYATDISAKMLEIAKRRANDANVSNISFQQTGLMEFKDNGSWDVILGMSILHLLKDRKEHIQRAYDLLKPGGVFISSTACIADMSTVFKWIAPLFRWSQIMPKVHVFNSEQLRAEFIEAGFSVEYEWRPGPDKSVFMVVKKPSSCE